MPEELDRDLQQLFRDREDAALEPPPEPFCGELFRRIAKERAARARRHWLCAALAGALCAASASYIVSGTAWLCAGLARVFAIVGDFLATPAGLAALAVAALLPLLFRRSWLSRLA